jgi:hypothetical protein
VLPLLSDKYHAIAFDWLGELHISCCLINAKGSDLAGKRTHTYINVAVGTNILEY